jgi:hypothetical protein
MAHDPWLNNFTTGNAFDRRLVMAVNDLPLSMSQCANSLDYYKQRSDWASKKVAELEAQLFRANFLISYLANAMDKNTGAEPSVSVEHHALTELLEYANSLTGEE